VQSRSQSKMPLKQSSRIFEQLDYFILSHIGSPYSHGSG
jgi:hypothetical protein